MTYTFLSAAYANAESTAALVVTAEAGPMLVSEADTPEIWMNLHSWGTPEPYEPPIAPIPHSATKLGLKRALDEIGRWNEVRSMIEAYPAIAEEWDLAIEIRRNDPIFEGFVTSGAFSNSEVDQVFKRAAEIVA